MTAQQADGQRIAAFEAAPEGTAKPWHHDEANGVIAHRDSRVWQGRQGQVQCDGGEKAHRPLAVDLDHLTPRRRHSAGQHTGGAECQAFDLVLSLEANPRRGPLATGRVTLTPPRDAAAPSSPP